MNLKLYIDLKYIGDNIKLKSNNGIWHCTNFVESFKTGKKQFVIQQPFYKENTLVSYCNLCQYVLTECQQPMTESHRHVS